jgi:NAD(P)-dependent dehydrogenase (short-subunit alcohol dehydrogenase family)
MSRLILLTGVTRGLGKALVARFVALGHTVAGCGRDATQIAALAREYGAPHSFASVDVGDDDQVGRWIARVLREQGTSDLVLNNAALMNRPAPLWEVSAAEFDALTRVNLNGIANVIRHITPALIEAGRGVIVNFSSGWGRSTSPEVAPYCATKWGVEGLTGALAQDLPTGLAAVALNPGVIDTDMLRACWSGGAAAYPKADAWAAQAAPWLLKLGAKDNGRALTAPGAAD